MFGNKFLLLIGHKKNDIKTDSLIYYIKLALWKKY